MVLNKRKTVSRQHDQEMTQHASQSEKEEKKNVGKGRREGGDNAGGKKNSNEYHKNTNFEIHSFGVHTPHPTRTIEHPSNP